MGLLRRLEKLLLSTISFTGSADFVAKRSVEIEKEEASERYSKVKCPSCGYSRCQCYTEKEKE